MTTYPLTKPQQAIWQMEQYHGGPIANITGSVFFDKPYEPVAIAAALNEVIKHHDALRIRLHRGDGSPRQYIEAHEPRDFEYVSHPTEDAFNAWADTLARTPFDLYGRLHRFFIINAGGRMGFVHHLHHLIADAWSVHLLANAVIRYLRGETPAPSGHGYLQYLETEHAYEASERHEKDRAFFLSAFERCSEPVYLAAQMAADISSERLDFAMDGGLSAQINDFCTAHGLSPYAFITGTLAIYIYRVKDADDFYLGTAVLNRAGRVEKETAGMFINSAAVPCHIDEMKSTRENLIEHATTLRGVLRHAKYPYGDCLADIRARHGDIDRLYDVVLSFQNATLTDGVEAHWHDCGCQGEALNIHVNDRSGTGRYHLDYSFQTEAFGRHDIERLHGHLLSLMTDIMENPTKKPRELKLLSDDEYQQVVYDFNDTAVDYPKEKCIHQLFEEQATRTPDATAVIFEDVAYSYRWINEMANSLAHILREKGVGRDDIVAIIARRSHKIIVAQLAILKAGGAYLPLDPDYPEDRIHFMLKDAGCKVALTLGVAVDGIDLGDDGLFGGDVGAIENVNSPDDLCYTICTSGSTGEAKCVMVSHRNLMNFCDNNNKNEMQAIIAGKCRIFLGISSFSFDMASTEVYLALLNNHTLVLASENQIGNPKELARMMEMNYVDFILTVPTRIMSFLDEKDFVKATKRLKVLSLGGEVLTKDMVNNFRIHADALILNGYGPAETTMACVWETVSSDITIGRPIANTQIYILDRHLSPLPIGAVGELCISGDGVGCGYLNRPELTAEKFIANPFIEGKRMYKSGDLARWREDGQLEYIGRMDNQVKIRGLRIELGEIETVMAKHEGIRQAAVVDKKDGSGRQYLCAYYVSDGEIDEKTLRTELAKTLPRYMIPHFFTRLEAFPTTPSGKTARRSFPPPDFAHIHTATAYRAPATEREKQLTLIIQSVLALPRVGMDDDFFALGGDSLKAIELAAHAAHAGFRFHVQALYEHPTPALLLAHIEANSPAPPQYAPADFADIHALLTANVVSGAPAPSRRGIGDLLLTGATGWLGAHVLDEFLTTETGIAYCLVRGKDMADSRERLAATLAYCFGDKYKDCPRITVIHGDIREQIDLTAPVDTVIHCAANVRHYGAWQHSYEANVLGAENVIALAQAKSARLIHISTTSVSGNSFDHDAAFPPTIFDETKLFIGQPLTNVYVRSKFEAEAAVLQARLAGTDTAVIRVGNLCNRYSDLKFQKNHGENATLAILGAFIGLGCYPAAMAAFPLEFSPVDLTAAAIIRLARLSGENLSLFHAYNENSVTFATFAATAAQAGLTLKPVPAEQFAAALRTTGESSGMGPVAKAFILDRTADGSADLCSNITLANDFTAQHLAQCGFSWPELTDGYLADYVAYFMETDYWRKTQ